MISLSSTNLIEVYIQKVTELSQSEKRIPTVEELTKIGSDLGISMEDIAAARKHSQDNFIRAQGYVNLKRWDDAISELQEAVAFNPSDTQMLIHLAKAHLGRWYDKHKHQDKEDVELRAKQCLMVQPESAEALSVLSQIDKGTKQYMRLRFGLLISLGLVLGSIGYVFYGSNAVKNLFNEPSQIQELQKSHIQLEEEIKQLKSQLATVQKESKTHKQYIQQQQAQINNLEKQVADNKNHFLESIRELYDAGKSTLELPPKR